ncbi:hypothetical protein CYMTET_28434 [Cymbomonas tetramitiformis]|uniref:Uncharacterized protein n=1 Tax=Cymbomonas tetramitiformis TaxID=36881 RepID=A0AAE0KVY2_9CHLO|nr:hypothetical protein CYMTET_28434 [Cymbomonas tetramitiformis]
MDAKEVALDVAVVGKYVVLVIPALPLVTLLTVTSAEETPAETAICALNSAWKEALKAESMSAETLNAENATCEETPSTTIKPGGKEGVAGKVGAAGEEGKGVWEEVDLEAVGKGG